ncbi:MAG: chemotaxis protein CheR [Denitrovibrio sp.]|nr:MAG: chemotaxis protein CheR [Denitrovibrio sp.]
MSVDNNIFSQNLSSKDFAKLKDFIDESCGIKLSENKRSMVEGRLRKRIRALNLSGYSEYIDLVLSNGSNSAEQMHLIDVITTNKTDFFREPNHFTLMTEKILPYLASTFELGTRETLNVWSSASSTGEEPYTIAMVLANYFGLGGNFNVFATDINTAVLQAAKKDVYTEEKASDIPFDYKKKYMLRSINRADKLVRFIPEIRSKTKFGRNNLKDEKYIVPTQVDIAFCRNVIIYFDAPTQESILNKICSYIKPGGFLFMGHSESVHGMKLPIRNYAPTVYIKE